MGLQCLSVPLIHMFPFPRPTVAESPQFGSTVLTDRRRVVLVLLLRTDIPQMRTLRSQEPLEYLSRSHEWYLALTVLTREPGPLLSESVCSFLE